MCASRGERTGIERACWCGGETASVIAMLHVPGSDGSFPLVRCDGCGVRCLDPAPDDAELVRFYDQDYYGATRRKFVGPIARVVRSFQGTRARYVARFVPPAGRILDIGCGNGGFLEMMKERGFEVEGTEWTEASARRVSSASEIRVHVGDLLSLGLPEKRFDAVTMWHVLEHVRDPFRTLEAVRRVLKDSGALFLALPNQESWQARCFGTSWFHLDPPRHLFGFGPRSMRVLVEASRFRLESLDTFSLEQNPYGFVQSTLNAVGFPRDRAYNVLKSTAAVGAATKLLDLSLVAALAVPGVLLSSVASCFRSGATMNLRARPLP